MVDAVPWRDLLLICDQLHEPSIRTGLNHTTNYYYWIAVNCQFHGLTALLPGGKTPVPLRVQNTNCATWPNISKTVPARWSNHALLSNVHECIFNFKFALRIIWKNLSIAFIGPILKMSANLYAIFQRERLSGTWRIWVNSWQKLQFVLFSSTQSRPQVGFIHFHMQLLLAEQLKRPWPLGGHSLRFTA
jgi:hypothetical protein